MYHVRSSVTIAVVLLIGSTARADIAQEAEQHGDIDVAVTLDPAAQSGHATGTVRIHARQEEVWALVRSCAEAPRLVPGLTECTVLKTAPDQSWQIIRHVLDYSWYLPKMTYDIRAVYDRPERISIERISGDLRVLKATWQFESQGEYTIAHYEVELAPGFWVPKWLVRVVLRNDLPKMLRALRTRAESRRQ